MNGAVGMSLGASVLSMISFQEGANPTIVLALIGSGGRGRQVITTMCKDNTNL